MKNQKVLNRTDRASRTSSKSESHPTRYFLERVPDNRKQKSLALGSLIQALRKCCFLCPL